MDHPRACGENFLQKVEIPSRKGSPPRVRGKLADFVKDGITYADHPRACGENFGCPRNRNRTGGSPPRVRGKPEAEAEAVLKQRITPARAGKTSPWTIGVPRARNRITPARAGKTRRIPLFTRVAHGGSPPRVRGKLLRLRSQNSSLVRITPARAGKTRGSKRRTCRCRDHPRACGENAILPQRTWKYAGSPPRVRGKPRGRDR